VDANSSERQVMFTGIIETIGTIQKLYSKGGGLRIGVEADEILRELRQKDSIAVDGCCLTVERVEGDVVQTFASKETLERTTLGALRVGSRVNLERAVAVGQRMGGHFVTGHVDAVGEIISIRKEGDSQMMRFRVPAEFHNLLVEKGSIAVDGISLTVVEALSDGFSAVIIPVSLGSTTLHWKKAGDRVNLEFDLIAKCILRFLEPHLRERGGLSVDFLTRAGFIERV
jgi:riboflavin synthase